MNNVELEKWKRAGNLASRAREYGKEKIEGGMSVIIPKIETVKKICEVTERDEKYLGIIFLVHLHLL